MPTPHRYRQQAEDLEAFAKGVGDRMERDILNKIASQFRRLAN
jgi:hypothetical protein